MSANTFRMRLPATSANLGPGFDTVAVALSLFLDIEACEADKFSISATGIDADQCSRLESNLVLRTYTQILAGSERQVTPLAIRMHNDIPLGMGCGSSAAGRLAAISMAVHFGELGWPPERILEEACQLEGHPDNASACWLGGFVAASNEAGTVRVARVDPPAQWRAIIVQPQESLPTSKARAILPANYTSADVVANLQAVSMLSLAFAQGRGDLLRAAMQDRIHQPYRAAICPLLPKLLPLAGHGEILGVALSGAGPAVLVIVGSEDGIGPASDAILSSLRVLSPPRLLVCNFQHSGAHDSLTDSRANVH